MIDDDGFLEELRQEFLAEAVSLLEQWEESFLKLEDTDDKTEQVTNIFRVAHCLKGTSSAVGYSDMAAFAHIVEDLLSIIKKSPECLTPEIVSLLLQCGDAFKQKVTFLTGKESIDWDVSLLSEQIHENLESFGHAPHKVTNEPVMEESLPDALIAPQDESWREVMADINQRFGVNLTEEHMHLSESEIASVIAAQKETQTTPSSAPDLRPDAKIIPMPTPKAEEKSNAPASKNVMSVKVDAYKIEKIMNLVGELVINKSQLANRVEQYRDDHLLEATYSLLEKTIRELQDETLGMRMISMKNLFLKCQRAVRDVSIKLGKTIEFVQSGEDVEIDRSMVELLTDPLLHMLRNSADHGIEQNGTVLLKAEHVGSKIIISIKDNGRGISAEKVFNKAKQNGLVSESTKITDLSENEIFQFIMMPGFSTAEKITDVSGRGVGLDVVKTTIEKMSGKVEIESQVGKGTRFRLILPLTTSIQEGIHVKAGNSSYIFPTEKVLEILSGDKMNFVRDPSGYIIFKYRDTVIPYSTLDSTLGISQDFKVCKMILILDVDGNHFGIGIDEFVAQVHVVLKPINEIVKTSTGISASCILSTGGIGFVIDTDEVCKLMLGNNREQNRRLIA